MILNDANFVHTETHVKLFYSESFGRFLGLVGFKKSFVVISYFFFTYCEKVREHSRMAPSLLETFSPPHPPFPTVSSFGTLVGGAYLMTSYLDKHFKSVRILCAADFCLQSNIVYLVQKK